MASTYSTDLVGSTSDHDRSTRHDAPTMEPRRARPTTTSGMYSTAVDDAGTLA